MLKAVYETTHDAVQRQNLEGLFFFQGFPVLGGVISIGGTLLSVAKMIEKTAKIAMHAFKKQDNTENLRDLKDWGIIFLNQLTNTLTLGIINNFLVGAAVHAGATGELPRWLDPNPT